MTSTEPSADEIRLDRYVVAAWRAKWWIILLALLATGVAAFIANRQPASYEATALVEVGRVWNQPLKDLFVTAETANSPGFIHELADEIVAWHEQIYEEAMRPHRERQQQLEEQAKQTSAASRDTAIKVESELE